MLQATAQIVTALLICFVQCLYIVLREAAVRSFALIVECIARVWWLFDCYVTDTVERGVIWFEVLPDESTTDIATYVTAEYVECIKTIWLCFAEAFDIYPAGTWYILGLEEIDDMEVGDYTIDDDYLDEELLCMRLE
jgi:hypothetical protein